MNLSRGSPNPTLGVSDLVSIGKIMGFIIKQDTNQRNNSCFNAFSRVDVRVEVKIPGGVESYYVDVRGER
jgi:hypothetical protein